MEVMIYDFWSWALRLAVSLSALLRSSCRVNKLGLDYWVRWDRMERQRLNQPPTISATPVRAPDVWMKPSRLFQFQLSSQVNATKRMTPAYNSKWNCPDELWTHRIVTNNDSCFRFGDGLLSSTDWQSCVLVSIQNSYIAGQSVN